MSSRERKDDEICQMCRNNPSEILILTCDHNLCLRCGSQHIYKNLLNQMTTYHTVICDQCNIATVLEPKAAESLLQLVNTYEQPSIQNSMMNSNIYNSTKTDYQVRQDPFQDTIKDQDLIAHREENEEQTQDDSGMKNADLHSPNKVVLKDINFIGDSLHKSDYDDLITTNKIGKKKESDEVNKSNNRIIGNSNNNRISSNSNTVCISDNAMRFNKESNFNSNNSTEKTKSISQKQKKEDTINSIDFNQEQIRSFSNSRNFNQYDNKLNQSELTESNTTTSYCTFHPDELISQICNNDLNLLCSDCIISGKQREKNYTFTKISKSKNMFNNLQVDQIENFNKKLSIIKLNKNSNSNFKNNVKEQQESNNSKIEEIFNFIQEYLDKKKNEVLTDLNNDYQIYINNQNKITIDQDKKQEQQNNEISNMNEILSSNSIPNLINAYRENQLYQDKLKNLNVQIDIDEEINHGKHKNLLRNLKEMQDAVKNNDLFRDKLSEERIKSQGSRISAGPGTTIKSPSNNFMYVNLPEDYQPYQNYKNPPLSPNINIDRRNNDNIQEILSNKQKLNMTSLTDKFYQNLSELNSPISNQNENTNRKNFNNTSGTLNLFDNNNNFQMQQKPKFNLISSIDIHDDNKITRNKQKPASKTIFDQFKADEGLRTENELIYSQDQNKAVFSGQKVKSSDTRFNKLMRSYKMN